MSDLVIDGVSVTQPATLPSVTTLLSQERIAEGAAWTVVTADGAAIRSGQAARLLDQIDLTEDLDSNPDAVMDQIASLHVQILSHDPERDTDAIEQSVALWSELHGATNSIESSWAGLISVLLRDPDFLYY